MEFTSDDRFIVETPENIRFGYDVADIGSRFLAVLIDSLIQGVLYVLLLLATAFLTAQLSDLDLPRWITDAFAVILLLVIFMIQFGYFLLFEIFLNGRTPGKIVFHLRVIKDNGYPLSPLDAIIRNVIRIIDFFPFAYGIGIIVMFLNKRAKRLGDLAAGTLVVKMRDEIRLQHLTSTAHAPANLDANLSADSRRLDEQDIELAESFLKRRSEMSNSAEMAVQIAHRLAQKIQAPTPATPQTAVQFLRDTVNAYRAPRA